MNEAGSGTAVRYRPAHDPDTWRAGTLVRPSPNGEEWLVHGALGDFWLPVGRLFLVEADEPAE